MDVLTALLTPNPDGCECFEPNPFKPEKCKNCGRVWTEHAGVISEAHLKVFLQQRQKSQEDKDKKEAEAKQAAAAKKSAKKRASQAVEDDWLFGADKDEPEKNDEESDDDLGFRMFSAADFVTSDPGPVGSMIEPNRQLKVVNLIDWGECDVAQELSGAGEATGSSASTMAPPVEVRQTLPDPRAGGDSHFQESFGSTPNLVPLSGNQDLVTEIQHLKQMLADANEEKDIQVAIVRDEVQEKEQEIQALLRQKNETEALLREARQKIESEASQPAAASSPEQLAEVQQLRAQVAEAEAKLEAREAQEAAVSAEVQQLRARVAESEAEAEGRTPPPDQSSEVLQLRARADEAEALLKAREAQEAAVSAEVQQLRARVAESEAEAEGRTPPPDQSSEVLQLRARADEAEALLKALRQRDPTAHPEAGNSDGTSLDHSIEVEQLKARASQAEERLEALQKDTASSEELEPLRARAAQAETQLQAATLESQAKQAELEAWQQKHAASSAEVVQLRTRLAEVEEELKALQHSAAAPVQHAEDAQAAKALRDVRMHAEQQLAWILQRMGVTHQAAELQKVGANAPCV
ncbi:unnamed protein product, partial [Symbiodinium sp. CCMP2456]